MKVQVRHAVKGSPRTRTSAGGQLTGHQQRGELNQDHHALMRCDTACGATALYAKNAENPPVGWASDDAQRPVDDDGGQARPPKP